VARPKSRERVSCERFVSVRQNKAIGLLERGFDVEICDSCRACRKIE
jgi:hypothetical protein